MNRMLIVLAVLVSFLLPASAMARPFGERYEHDGFFWRPLVLGVGYDSVSAVDGAATREISGVAVLLSPIVTMGGAVAENLILYGKVSIDIFSAFEATETVQSEETDISVEGPTSGHFGLGLIYYFMPRNLFVDISLGMEQINFAKSGRAEGVSGIGFGAQASFGREWWISQNWAMGIGVQASFGMVPDQWAGDAFFWTKFGGGLIGTLTFN